MPLTEVSATDIRRNASLRRPRSRRPSELEATPVGGKKSLEESAIQSMLRLRTETGDIGQFSVRPPRVPNLGSRRPRRGSGSFDSAQTTRSQSRPPTASSTGRRSYNHPRPRPSFSALSRQDTVLSSQTSYHTGRRPRVRGQRSFGLEGLASPPPVLPHGIQSHRSLVALRSQTDGAGHRPQSPVPYPARLRRPSYRNISPAFSDAQQAPYNSASAYPTAGSVGPIPSSMFPLPGHPQFYNNDMNRSVSSLQRFPSPSVSNAYYSNGRSPYPSASATPVSYRFPSPPVMSNQSWNGFHAMHRSETSSAAPIFYDYSESYYQDNTQTRGPDALITPLPSTLDHRIAEHETPPRIRNAQTPFGILPGSVFVPSELPGMSHSTSGELSHRRTSSQVSSRRSSAAASRIPKGHGRSISRELAVGTVTLLPPSLEAVESEHKDSQTTLRDTNHSQSIAESTVQLPESSQHADRRSIIPTKSIANLKQSKVVIQELGAAMAPEQPQYGESEFNTSAAGQNESEKRMSKSISLGPPITVAETNWQLPTLQFRPLSFSKMPPNQDDRSRSPTEDTRADQLGILCPTPERPVSSQSSRMRFSKILNLNEGLERYSSFRSSSGLLGKAHTPSKNSTLRATKFSFTPIPERSSKTEEMLSHQDSNVSRRIDALTPSQNTDCEKSTVESLLDQHIECLGLKTDTDGTGSEVSEQSSPITSASSVDVVRQTPRLSDLMSDDRWKRHVRSATTGFEEFTPLNIADETILVPQKLFHCATAQRSDVSNKIPSEGSTEAAQRPSESWMTLPSTSRGSRSIDQMRRLSESAVSHQTGLHTAFQDLVEPKRSFSPTDDRCSLVPTSANNALSSPRQTRRDSALQHEISYRRKLRLRLKLRKQSKSGSISESSRANESFHTAKSPSQGTYIHLGSTLDPVQPPTTTNDSIIAHKGSSIAPYINGSLECALIRRGNQIKPYKPSFDVTRKASIRTTRSRKSSMSLVDPINSTRMSSQYPRLAKPDLGPPLTPLTVGVGTSGQSIRGTTGPALREAKSFFSDGSSQQHARNSVRRRLHGLRNRLTISPKNSSDPLLVKEQHQRSLRFVSQSKLGRSSRTNSGETRGMSDFAYKKRKWTERLKKWWKRHKSLIKSQRRPEHHRSSGSCCNGGTPSTL